MTIKAWLIEGFLKGKYPKFVYRMIGKKIADKIKLVEDKDMEDGKMTEKKPWYKSKNIINGIVTVLIGLYGLVQVNLVPGLPAIPEWIFIVLASIGIYTRKVADTKIG